MYMYTYVMYIYYEMYLYIHVYLYSDSISTSSCSLSETVMTVPTVGNPCLGIQGYLRYMDFMKFLFILSLSPTLPACSPAMLFPPLLLPFP